MDNITLKNWSQQDGISFSYTAQERLCINGYLPISSVLAILDVISAVYEGVQDRTHRYGVKISINAEYVNKNERIKSG